MQTNDTDGKRGTSAHNFHHVVMVWSVSPTIPFPPYVISYDTSAVITLNEDDRLLELSSSDELKFSDFVALRSFTVI